MACSSFTCAVEEVHRLRVDFLVDGLHALLRQRTGVLDSAALAVGEVWSTPRGPNFFRNSGSFG